MSGMLCFQCSYGCASVGHDRLMAHAAFQQAGLAGPAASRAAFAARAVCIMQDAWTWSHLEARDPHRNRVCVHAGMMQARAFSQPRRTRRASGSRRQHSIPCKSRQRPVCAQGIMQARGFQQPEERHHLIQQSPKDARARRA